MEGRMIRGGSAYRLLLLKNQNLITLSRQIDGSNHSGKPRTDNRSFRHSHFLTRVSI
jgi:hypothetical protein